MEPLDATWPWGWGQRKDKLERPTCSARGVRREKRERKGHSTDVERDRSNREQQQNARRNTGRV